MTTKKKILFIINPISGITKKKRIPDIVNQYIDKNQYDCQIRYTQYRHHAIILAATAVKEQFDIVVAVGGDGSVNEVSSQLVNTKIALGIVPLGSGNGWARHFKIPLNPIKAIKLINKSKTITVDAATMNDRHFLNCAGVGFDAAVADHFAETPLRGFFSYLFSSIHQYMKYRSQEYEISIDTKNMNGRYFMISIMNGSQFGYNVKSIASAKPNDGLLHVMLVKPFHKIFAPLVTFLVMTNWLYKSPFVKLYKTKKIVIHAKENAVLQLDGEPIKVKKQIEVQVMPSCLKMLVAK